MIPECAVCYVADTNFTLPTLVSATGLRKFVPAEKAAVYVFLIDDDARVPDLSRFLAPFHIRVVSMSSSAYSNFNPDQFNPSHVSAAALGRFSLEGLLPDKHRRIVYLDGDTWMRRDPSALLEASITEGKIAAVEDMTYFRYRSPTPFGRTVREYFARLGLSRRNGYFNSGVLAASRPTWRSIMADAHKFFAANTAACKNHDQSALNVVAHDRRVRLSLQWNFQTSFRYLGIEDRVNPSVYHFTRWPKPWMGECEPWTDIYKSYTKAIHPFAPLKLPLTQTTPDVLSNHNDWARRKYRLLKSPLLARLVSICMGVDAYEAARKQERLGVDHPAHRESCD